MRGIILSVSELAWYLENYCSFRDYMVDYLKVEFCSDSRPVVDVFQVGSVLVFEPDVYEEDGCFRVVYRPKISYDSPGDAEILKFFENYSDSEVLKELFEQTYVLTGGEYIRKELVKRLRSIATILRTQRL